MKRKKILAMIGSLRHNSANHIVMQSVKAMAPEGVDIVAYEGLGDLPHFDGSEDPPALVRDLREQVKEADGILFCTPEYTFGIPGSLKNALDWTVGSGELTNKPVAVITGFNQWRARSSCPCIDAPGPCLSN